MPPQLLVVDCGAAAQSSLSRELAARYDVVAAANARDAQDRFRSSGPFPVVVCALNAAERGGPGLLRALHSDCPQSVGVLVSEDAAAEIVLQAVQDGHAFRHVARPCPADVLFAAIDSALERHAALEEAAQQSERLLFAKESLLTFTQLLEERIARQTAELSRLHRYAVDLNAAGSMHEVARLAAGTTSDLLGGRGVLVQVWDGENDGRGVESCAGPEMSECMHREPLLTQEGPIGEIVVDLGPHTGHTGATQLPAHQRKLLASICSSTAVAAHNEFRRQERDHAQHATILALARLSEQRDNETGKHLERVAAYCRLIARGLREHGKHLELVTEAWIEDLVRSSPLHDIGKVGIPDAILLKPGKLTSDEWETMKRHAEIGAVTLASVSREFGSQGYLSMGRDIAWCHHEKWDGSGYPRGLRGAEIPLSARIVALADVYDALTTIRPYKEAWSHADAIEWVCSRADKHFDPDVVAAFAANGGDADRIRGASADTLEEVIAKLRG